MNIPFKNLIHKLKKKPEDSETDEKNSHIGLCLYPKSVRIVKCVKSEDKILVDFISGKDFEKNLFTEERFNDQFKEYLSNIKFSEEKVNIGLKNSDVKEEYKFFPKVEEEELKKIVEGEKETGDFEPENEIIKYAIMNEKDKQFLVMITGVSKELVNRMVSFIKDFSFSPCFIETPQLALRRLLSFNGDINSESNCLVINDNIDNLSISLYQGTSLNLNRKISSIGGNAINRAISKKIDVGIKEAREIKKKLNLEKEKDLNQQDKIFTVVKDILMRVVVELERSIQYFINENPDYEINKVFVTGPNLLKNIDKYLNERLNIEVELINPFKKVEIESERSLNTGNFPHYSFAIATGLALRGLID